MQRTISMIWVVLLAACGPAPDAPAPVAVEESGGTPSPRWVTVASGSSASLRGLSVVDEQVIWASGSEGTVLRTVDGGATWLARPVAGAGELDFRDVEAFDARTAVVASAGQPARIYRTADGGATWDLAYEHPHPDAFFDALAFWDAERGLIMSDPVDGRFVVLATADGGRTWAPLEAPAALTGEAGFAASGSNLAVGPDARAWIGTGGAAARVLVTADGGESWSVAETPLVHGRASTGIFSLAFRDARHGFAVGGDYQDPPNPTGNHARTEDGGRTWAAVPQPPRGYRSCVVVVQQIATPGVATPVWIAVGRGGTDVSYDDGLTWTAIGDEGYYVASVGSLGEVWAAGSDGRIARLDWGGTH